VLVGHLYLSIEVDLVRVVHAAHALHPDLVVLELASFELLRRNHVLVRQLLELVLEHLLFKKNLRMLGHDHVGSTSLEPKHVRQALTILMKEVAFVVFSAESTSPVSESLRPLVREDVTLWLEVVELAKVENRRLRQEEVFTDVLLVVAIPHLLLINVINELLDLVLVVAGGGDKGSLRTRKALYCFHSSRGLVTEQVGL